MANRINASNLSDLLLPMRQRGNAPGVYFVRLCQWSPEIKDFLWRYQNAICLTHARHPLLQCLGNERRIRFKRAAQHFRQVTCDEQV